MLRDHDGRSEMLLATSGGITEAGPAEHPFFFRGLLTDPAAAAQGMLACAAIARSRYFTPGSVVAALRRDPVVTSSEDRLRFESFSSCCGVHARLDLLPAALANPPAASGTTNVDFGDAMRAALGSAVLGGPLLLTVGSDELAVDAADGSVTERKVSLPARWLSGFGEVQALSAQMRPVGGLTGTAARRFLRSIPRSARSSPGPKRRERDAALAGFVSGRSAGSRAARGAIWLRRPARRRFAGKRAAPGRLHPRRRAGPRSRR